MVKSCHARLLCMVYSARCTYLKIPLSVAVDELTSTQSNYTTAKPGCGVRCKRGLCVTEMGAVVVGQHILAGTDDASTGRHSAHEVYRVPPGLKAHERGRHH